MKGLHCVAQDISKVAYKPSWFQVTTSFSMLLIVIFLFILSLLEQSELVWIPQIRLSYARLCEQTHL